MSIAWSERARRGKSLRAGLLAGAFVLGAAGLAACGGTEGGGGETASKPATSSTPAPVSTPANDCATVAKERIAAAKADPKLRIEGGPFDMSKNAGKTVWIISASQANPFNNTQSKGAAAGAKAAGMKPIIFDGKGNPRSFNEGVSQAVAHKADGILLQGIEPKLVASALKDAEANGIPVVDSFNGAPDQPLEHGLEAHVTADYAAGGRWLADWILADSNCDANTVLINMPVFSVGVEETKGFEEEYKSLCPKCKLRVQTVALETVSLRLFSQTQSELRRDPTVNYFVPVFDFMVTYALPGVEQSVKTGHKEVKILSHDGLKPNLKWVREGKQAADVILPTLEFAGWAGVDRVGRAMAGLPSPPFVVPTQVVDKENIGASDSELLPGFADYESAFKELWQG